MDLECNLLTQAWSVHLRSCGVWILDVDLECNLLTQGWSIHSRSCGVWILDVDLECNLLIQDWSIHLRSCGVRILDVDLECNLLLTQGWWSDQSTWDHVGFFGLWVWLKDKMWERRKKGNLWVLVVSLLQKEWWILIYCVKLMFNLWIGWRRWCSIRELYIRIWSGNCCNCTLIILFIILLPPSSIRSRTVRQLQSLNCGLW